MEEHKMSVKKTKKVRCLICGAVFDSDLERCPVCGVGPEMFVPYEEEEAAFRKDTDEVFVILGNGAAGISAAEEIRKRNSTCSIIMVSDEPVLSYNRPMLTKSLSTLVDAGQIAVHDEDWYKQNNIVNMLGLRAEKIDTAAKAVTLSDGSLLNYDKCIYALGSECFIPPNLDCGKPEAVAIRRISDVKKIRELTPKVKNTVVIGGGVLGLEAAWEMSKSSRVTILEAADKLMPRQLDDAAGDFLADIIKSKGIDFRLGAKIRTITGDSSVTGVELEDGTLYPADLVIISCGVRPNAALAKEAGLAVDRGVVVNEYMETSVADIYACGDCAYYNGINYALWSQALEMGKAAGANAAGERIEYTAEPPALTFEGMDTSLFAAGDNGRNTDVKYKTREVRDMAKNTYEKYFFINNRLAGVILIGDTSKLAQLTDALKERQSYEMVP
jgi:NAD(P)H-nitrite reductase large subunit